MEKKTPPEFNVPVDKIPKWAQVIVRRTEEQFASELSSLTHRIELFQAMQLRDFLILAEKLISEMCKQINSEAEKNGYNYLRAMKVEREMRARFGAVLDRLKS